MQQSCRSSTSCPAGQVGKGQPLSGNDVGVLKGEQEAKRVVVSPWLVPVRCRETPSSPPEAGSVSDPSSSKTVSVIPAVTRSWRGSGLLWAAKQDTHPSLPPQPDVHGPAAPLCSWKCFPLKAAPAELQCLSPPHPCPMAGGTSCSSLPA